MPSARTALDGRPDFAPPAAGPEDWQPDDPGRLATWMRLQPETKRMRFNEALRRLDALREVTGRPAGESERKAIARIVTEDHRSSFRRWQDRYRRVGFEGLLYWQVAPPSPMPDAVRVAICTLVRVDPAISVEAVVVHVQQFHDFKTSETTVKRVLREAGLNRPRGHRPGQGQSPEQRLELGGAKLLEAAAVETGYLAALAKGVEGHARGLEKPRWAFPRDTEGRDEYGRFTSPYNERFRKQPGDEIGPGFDSVELKREFKDPAHLQITQVKPETLERKLMALWYSPLLARGGRWDGIRVSQGQLLDELCGYAYMPATLERFTGELKYAGVADTLWEIHARKWLELTSEWGQPKWASVLFVDGTTKPVWTRLFSEATKVSNVGRTMPGLETVAFHSGYGVPLWMLTYSGRAPLVREVPKALERLESMWGTSSVGRIVVIDAEGNSVPFLKGLQADKRAFVTRLRPSLVKGKRILNRNNYRAYRQGDRVRSGVADFNDPEANKDDEVKTFRMRVVELERRGTAEVIYLGASTLLREDEWKPQDIADLYFGRWPQQEANFRAVNEAVGLKEVHGYGKRLVTNVSVVTKQDELEQRSRRAEALLAAQEQRAAAKRERLRQAEQELARRRRRQETVKRKVQERVVPGGGVSLSTEELISEQGELAQDVVERMGQVDRHREQLAAAEGKVERTMRRLAGYVEERKELESRRTLFAHDVELDSLFSLLKVGLVMLVTVVLRKYLGDAKMAPVTFLERVATLPARLLTMPRIEIVTFVYNTRDPEVMGLLEAHCEAINALRLRTRSGRRLQLRVDPAPEPRRPKPPGSRVGSGDRFKR